MTVRYMPHMPELQGVSGKARFEGGTLHFDVASGTAVGLRVSGATIDLTGLDAPAPQQAAIRMPIAGSAQDVIRFLARPKLGLPKEVLYDYRRLGGEVAIDLSLGFPLINALTVAELDLKAEAVLSGFSLKGALGEVDLTDAAARVKYGNSELSVNGTGKLDGNVVEIGWRELFGAKAAFRRRYDLKGTVPAALVAKAGFPSPEPYITGPIATTLHYQVATNGTGEVVGRFDIKGAKANVAPLGWTKEPGTDGQMLLTLKLAAGGKLTTADFEGRANGLLGKGVLRFNGDNVLQQVTLQQIKIGQSDLAIDWKRTPDGVELSLKGPSLELPRIRNALKVRDEYAAKDPAGPAGTSRARTRITLQLQQVLTQRGTLGYANGRAGNGGRAHRLGRHDDRRRQGLDLAHHAGGCGADPVLLCRRFRDDAEGGGLARRAGERLPAHRRPLQRRRRRRAARWHAQDGPLPPGEGDAERHDRHAQLDDRGPHAAPAMPCSSSTASRPTSPSWAIASRSRTAAPAASRSDSPRRA